MLLIFIRQPQYKSSQVLLGILFRFFAAGGRNDFIPELRILLRDWSTRVFFLNARLDRLSTRYVDSDYSWKKRLLWMRQENDRLQNEIRSLRPILICDPSDQNQVYVTTCTNEIMPKMSYRVISIFII